MHTCWFTSADLFEEAVGGLREMGRNDGLMVANLIEGLLLCGRFKRWPTNQELIRHDASGPNIGFAVVANACGVLRALDDLSNKAAAHMGVTYCHQRACGL